MREFASYATVTLFCVSVYIYGNGGVKVQATFMLTDRLRPGSTWHDHAALRRRSAECRWQWDRNSTYMYESSKLAATRIPFDVSVCLLDSDASGEELRAWRLGPLTGRGGFDYSWVPVSSLFVPPAGGSFVVAAYAVSVDASSNVIGLPPIHNHHSHLFVQGDDDPDLPNWWRKPLLLNHQDSACPRTRGGDACFTYRLPHGHAMRVTESVDFASVYNDVRPASSEPLSYWIEVGVAVKDGGGESVRVDLWSVYHYALMESDERPFFGTFPVPRSESVVWMQSRYSVTGRLLNIWMHTHSSQGFRDAWFIEAALSSIGLETGELRMPRCDVFVPSRFGMSVEDIRSRIRQAMARSALSFKCMASRDGSFDEGDRQVRWECAPDAQHIRAGQTLSTVVFFGPPFTTTTSTIRQHVHFQGYIVTRRGQGTVFTRYVDRTTDDATAVYQQSTGMPYGSNCSASRIPTMLDHRGGLPLMGQSRAHDAAYAWISVGGILVVPFARLIAARIHRGALPLLLV